MKYHIEGKTGWIGSYLVKLLKDKVVDTFENADVIINCIGKTNIDWCEKNKWETIVANVEIPRGMAIRCKEQGKKYVHLSSACIFESKNAKDIKYEDSIPNPKCFYAKTKALAEELVQEVNEDAMIVRFRLPLSEIPHPRNTLNKLLKYDTINTNQESVTIVEDMFPVLIDLIEKNEKGIFHLINEGTISPAEIATELGHLRFKSTTKLKQDRRLAKEGRAKRVTTYVGSRRIPLLPNIRERIVEVTRKFKESKLDGEFTESGVSHST